MRPIKVETPLGGGVLLFRRMRGHEELGRLFELEVELLSKRDDISFKDLIAKPMTVELELPGGGTRHFNGIVSRFEYIGVAGDYHAYRAILRPSLWLLTRTAGCKIFQNKKAPDLIKEVIKDHGVTELRDALSASYAEYEYKVQYRESDFDFVSRLMEQEGIYYFFEHEHQKHTMVLADSSTAHGSISGYAEVPFYPKTPSGRRERDHIDGWSVTEELEPGAHALQDFDPKRPRANLEVKLASQHPLARRALEVYDYPGQYVERSEGEQYVRVRLEELYARQALFHGEGNARGISPGHLFKLTHFPRGDQNAEYLVVSARYEAEGGEFESKDAGKEPSFRVRFTAIESQRPFRPGRVTPKPLVRGPQTAIVTGKSGEEIWTDDQGRIKVQFHWDRVGAADQKSSCWVRVSQGWAGAAWGSLFIPRIGQEVVVEFLEGDPDRPLVTGAVYNGDHKPPYLPGEPTHSGIKTRSTKGGGESNANEIRFEDKKDSEKLFVQAEKDHEVVVKHDETWSVGHDRKREVKHDETLNVGHDRTREVKNDETVKIGGNLSENVEKDLKIEVKGKRTEKVGGDESITISGARTVSVSKDQTVSISGKLEEKVEKDLSLTVQGALTETVSKDASITVSGKRSQTIGKNEELTVSQKLVVSAGQEITFSAGAASITLKSSGDVVIKGVNVTVEGAATAKVKSSGEVSIMGSVISNK